MTDQENFEWFLYLSVSRQREIIKRARLLIKWGISASMMDALFILHGASFKIYEPKMKVAR